VQAAWAGGPTGNGPPYVKPYIFTEFGNQGEWEVPNDANGVPLEPTDVQKAAAYPASWACITGSNGNGAAGVSLGGVAFIYGNANDFGGVWYNNEHTTAMTKRLSYFAQQEMFTGQVPTANRPPACQSLTLSPVTNIKRGAPFTVSTAFVDPEGDPLTFNVMVGSKYIDGSGGLANAIFTPTGAQTFSVTAPTKLGVWKLYVYAFDGRNNVGIETASFRVVP
jgi:hypothetical protein